MGEAADRLKLSLRQLAAIEQGDFASLPGVTFARGFIRNYARFLEVDAEMLAARLDVCLPLNSPPAQLEPVSVPSAPAPRSFALPLFGAVLLLLAAAWFFWPAGKVDSIPTTASAPVEVAPEPIVSNEPSPASATIEMPSVVISATSAPVAVVASAASAVVAKPAPVVASASVVSATANTSGTFSVHARGEAWVSIVDADGKKLLFETLPADSSKQVQGRPPFHLKIGNAAQVDLSYNGQPVDLAGKTRGTTAKLELN